MHLIVSVFCFMFILSECPQVITIFNVRKIHCSLLFQAAEVMSRPTVSSTSKGRGHTPTGLYNMALLKFRVQVLVSRNKTVMFVSVILVQINVLYTCNILMITYERDVLVQLKVYWIECVVFKDAL